MIKKILILLFLLIPIKANALIEVDITRGNLNPLPLAVSPLSIDEVSRKGFEKITVSGFDYETGETDSVVFGGLKR